MAGEPVRESIVPTQVHREPDLEMSSMDSTSSVAAGRHDDVVGQRNASSSATMKPPAPHGFARQTDAWDRDDEVPDEIVALSREEAQRLFGPEVSRPSRVTPMRVVGAQCVVTICAMVVFGLLSHQVLIAALSSLIGGVICWVPSAVFAVQLKARARASIGAWMLAEGIKLGMTIAMFIVVAVYFRDVRWLPLLVTYALALKTYWLALAWK